MAQGTRLFCQENRVKHLPSHIFVFPSFRYDSGGSNAAGLATPTISVASATATADGSVSVLGSPIRFEPPELDFQQQ